MFQVVKNSEIKSAGGSTGNSVLSAGGAWPSLHSTRRGESRGNGELRLVQCCAVSVCVCLVCLVCVPGCVLAEKEAKGYGSRDSV